MATQSRVRAALATVEAADAAENLADLPGLVLPALMDTVGAESALWTELYQAASPFPVRVVSCPGWLFDDEAGAALERHAPGFPLIRHTRPGGDGRPIRRSDLQSLRAFRRSGMYADVAREMGLSEMLAMALKTGSLHVCISLNRAGPDFRPAEVELVTQLRPLLTRRVMRLSAGPAGGLAIAGGDTRAERAVITGRQRQVLSLVASGLTDAAIGRRLGCSPRTVDKHLEHVYRKLGVSCRTAAIAACQAEGGAPAPGGGGG
jgi:DNA-binding CsgD family transcriptional regulator